MTVLTQKIGAFYRDLVSRELKTRLNQSSDVFLLNYHRLKSAEMTELRKSLATTGAGLLVTKNSFIKKVFQETQRPTQALPMVDGPMALVFVKDDAAVVSKVLVNFAKNHEALQIRGGFLAEKVISSEDIKTIARLPSRKGLYQQVALALNAPIAKLAMSLNQIVAKLVYALNAVKDKKGK